MYFTYVDESGDTGAVGSNYFILTGVIIHEDKMDETLSKLLFFRREIKEKYKLNIGEEIHCAEFMNRKEETKSRKSFEKIPKHIRIKILKDFLLFLNTLELKTFSIVLNKNVHFKLESKYNVLELVWNTFLNRLDRTLKNGNVDGKRDEKTIIISDVTTDEIIKITRKCKKINFVPSKFGSGRVKVTLTTILEDPFMKDSKKSYFIQCADVICYFVKQLHDPSCTFKNKGLHNYYKRLTNIHLSVVSSKNKIGIVNW